MKRQDMEKSIIQAFVEDAIAAGHRIAVSLERGYDTEDMLLGSTDVEKILGEALAGDDAHLFIQPGKGPTTQNGVVISQGWVFVVLGNSGWDVVSDYVANDLTEKLLTRANALAETLEADHDR